MRVFVSIRPPAAVLDHLDAALDEVRTDAGRLLRWTDPEQLHMTLAFHPRLGEGAVEDHAASIARIADETAPFGLELTGAGEFSRRTLWVGVGGDTDALRSLMSADLLGDEERERRRAHLTVARVSATAVRGRGGRRRRHEEEPADLLLARAVRALAVYRGPAWTVDEIQLVTSHLGRGRSGGPLHEVLDAFPLTGGDR